MEHTEIIENAEITEMDMENPEIIEINVENSENENYCQNTYKCTTCEKMLKTKDSLTNHIRTVHAVTRIKCEQ